MNILAICAHPDDEVLGCGGTLARHAAAGDQVAVCFMTDGEAARTTVAADNALNRQLAAKAAASVLGVQIADFGKFPDNRLDTIALLDLARHVEKLALEHQPDIVYTHHGGDLNVDHRLTFQAVLTAFRPLCASGAVESIISFEVSSSTEWSSPEIGLSFVPNHFVDISRTLDRKISAMECYRQEMRSPPHPRSANALRALAAWRGAASGIDAAEAFVLVRRIIRAQ
jgi:LmbE family N-acetylglucosaminyl deacetylase